MHIAPFIPKDLQVLYRDYAATSSYVFFSPPGTSSLSCKPQPTCKKCISSSPDCAWCKELNFTKDGESESSRCDSEEELLIRGCKSDQIVHPKSSYEILKNRSLSKNAEGETVVQLTPQKIKVKLRPRMSQIFPVQFKRAEGYPVDLYYLMDLSYSMKDDLQNVKSLGLGILNTLKNVTKSVKIGFGAFVDKTVLPYVSMVTAKLKNPCPDRTETCQPPFSFRHVLALTDNATEFEVKVSQQKISGNLDSPEGGFDALMQAAVCENQIGWRNVTRLLLYATDDTFHAAGDGKLGGIYRPNDGRCHLNSEGEYSQSNVYDYPSVGHLVHALSAANIQPIFAVTASMIPVYQELSKLIPKSVVGELREDSSNIVNLTAEAYNNLSSSIALNHFDLPKNLVIWYSSNCSGSSFQDRGQCSNIKINQLINFSVNITALDCLSGPQTFKIKPLGFNDELTIEVETLCDCSCNDDPNSTYCSGNNGVLSCGICNCSKQRSGKKCECDQSDDSSLSMEEQCRKDNASLLCSGKGRCECGKCSCGSNVHGKYCECDNMSCERHNNQLCGGNGVCRCGTCECNSNYTGKGCDCSVLSTSCVTGETKCNGYGECKCNKCVCEPGYYGPTCGKCHNCSTTCQIYRDCVECLAFKTGPRKDDCDTSCSDISIDMQSNLEEDSCSETTTDSGIIIFKIIEEKNGKTQIYVQKKAEVADRTFVIIMSVLPGIVLIGLLVIVIYRVMIEVYDRREYARFEKEKRNAKWTEVNNPLFKSATTTIVNPNFGTE
nr:PREDICTED: integrin beta-7 isoform X1 [Latimeria chalumnae]|eukprot:XP_014350673.1 PREDICTED: integrin beta-7 isoform X1 [Latimeria chalumnae]